jgi:MFS family permease
MQENVSTTASTKNIGWVKVTLLLVSSLTVMSGATIAASLPHIKELFASTPNADMLSRLVLTIPALFIALCAPVAGIIVDRYGRKKLLIASLLLYAVAGSSGLYLNTLTSILIGRALLGVAVAGIMTTAVTLISDYFQGSQRSSFMGLQAAFMGLGGVVFISAGGFLADIDWRFPFAIYLFSLLLIPIAYLYLPEPIRDSNKKQVSSTHSVKSNSSTIAFLFFIVALYMILFYMVPVQIPFLLNDSIKVSSTLAGLAISLLTFSSAVTSLFYTRIKAVLNFNAVYAIVFIIVATGYIFIWRSESYGMVLFALLIAGIGGGLFLPNINLHVMSLASPETRGRMASGITTAMFTGQFLSPLAVQPIEQQFTLSTAFLWAGVLMFLLAGVFIIVSLRKDETVASA